MRYDIAALCQLGMNCGQMIGAQTFILEFAVLQDRAFPGDDFRYSIGDISAIDRAHISFR